MLHDEVFKVDAVEVAKEKKRSKNAARRCESCWTIVGRVVCKVARLDAMERFVMGLRHAHAISRAEGPLKIAKGRSSCSSKPTDYVLSDCLAARVQNCSL